MPERETRAQWCGLWNLCVATKMKVGASRQRIREIMFTDRSSEMGHPVQNPPNPRSAIGARTAHPPTLPILSTPHPRFPQPQASLKPTTCRPSHPVTATGTVRPRTARQRNGTVPVVRYDSVSRVHMTGGGDDTRGSANASALRAEMAVVGRGVIDGGGWWCQVEAPGRSSNVWHRCTLLLASKSKPNRQTNKFQKTNCCQTKDADADAVAKAKAAKDHPIRKQIECKTKIEKMTKRELGISKSTNNHCRAPKLRAP
ncbi:hypothetical protein P171DRAFT_442133 [Karstenula rhodostoma CBS 690.94]|uniref:Uncharacterized protein n=1 Tax=Karstenula rhodostoma CBS 690.94 TaxID=1392251 RepID=A0A9P4PQ95_9PLEO|nr:hypothetical protein P171DRAFT_442133 [Karstenula rhodostoma CBS 690.94]